MKTRYLFLVYLIMSITDIIVVNLSFVTAYDYTYFRIDGAMDQLIIANNVWIFSAVYFGLYNRKFIHSLRDMYSLTIKSFVLFSIIFISYIFIFKSNVQTGDVLVLFNLILLIGLILNRYMYYLLESLFKKCFRITRPVAVIGTNHMAMRLAGFFKESDNHFAFEGFLNKGNASYLDNLGQLLPSILNQIKTAAESGIKEVYVSLAPDRINEYDFLQKEADKYCLRLKLVTDMPSSLISHLKISYMGEFAVLSNRYEPLEEIENRFKKRVFDIIFSSLVIVFIMSWLFPIIGLLIKLQSPGPVLFKQLRSGKDNRSFLCYKFRSMRLNDENHKQATIDDNRITKIGRFLRRTSLDELPQFLNVLLGDMSTIGPRPHILTMTKEYSQIINQYMVRHLLKSGITGWAQVNGLRGETKDPELMRKRVEYDIWYLENWSMGLDLKIVIMTILQVIKGDKNAY
ncbi:exopolysaccharide biosynthesis polyprenyl glycosylphosphotransferase [Mucilaginibacter sp.]|uniref:exopolysaccharide biosynthesis polyprenyl glycosylphosphotransferase n=1 Tax=Mucilaginibacter sp. TaxID=1882438 RepID=UPI0035664298